MNANEELTKVNERLIKAATRGDVDIVFSLLIAGANADARDKNGKTPLFWASRYGHYRVCETLLEHAACVNSRGEQDWPPLRIAAQWGHAEVLKLLLEKGANEYAVLDRNHKYALRGDVDPNQEIRDVFRRFPLYEAARRGDQRFCEILLKDGANPKSSQMDVFSPLKGAIENGSVEIVKLLLRNGANANETFLNCRNRPLISPKSFATLKGQTKVEQLFLGPRVSTVLFETSRLLADEKGHRDHLRLLPPKGVTSDDIQNVPTEKVHVDQACQSSTSDAPQSDYGEADQTPLGSDDIRNVPTETVEQACQSSWTDFPQSDYGEASYQMSLDSDVASHGCICSLRTRLDRIKNTTIDEVSIQVLESDDVETLHRELLAKQDQLTSIVLKINGMVVDLRKIKTEFNREMGALREHLRNCKSTETSLRHVLDILNDRLAEVMERN